MTIGTEGNPVLGSFGEYVSYLTASVSGQDARGNDVLTYTPSQVGPCAFVPGAEAEAAEGTRQVTSADQIYLPQGTPVSPLDQILRTTGEQYHVVGESSTWKSPWTGTIGPVLVKLRRVTGATAMLPVESTDLSTGTSQS
jgi:hypothetical protein